MATLHFQIKRVTPTAIAFQPPKGSDALHEALKIDYPHLDSLQKRMQQAVLDFLLAEQVVQEQLAEQAVAPYLSTPPSSQATPPSYLASPESSFVAYTPPSENVSPKQASTNVPAQQEMMDVWSLPTATQTKQHKRRCMTTGEKEQYRMKRLQGACPGCKKRRRKCNHEVMTPQTDSSAQVSPAQSANQLSRSKAGKRSSQSRSRHVISDPTTTTTTTEQMTGTEALAAIDFSQYDLPEWSTPENAAEAVDPFTWDLPTEQDWTLFSGVASPSSQFADDSFAGTQTFPETQSQAHPNAFGFATLSYSWDDSHLDARPGSRSQPHPQDSLQGPSQDTFATFAHDNGLDTFATFANSDGVDAIAQLRDSRWSDRNLIYRELSSPDSQRSSHARSCGQDIHEQFREFTRAVAGLHQNNDQQLASRHTDIAPTNLLLPQLPQTSPVSCPLPSWSYEMKGFMRKHDRTRDRSRSGQRQIADGYECSLSERANAFKQHLARTHAIQPSSQGLRSGSQQHETRLLQCFKNMTGPQRSCHSSRRSVYATDHASDSMSIHSRFRSQMDDLGSSKTLSSSSQGLSQSSQDRGRAVSTAQSSSQLLLQSNTDKRLSRSSQQNRHLAPQREYAGTKSLSVSAHIPCSWIWCITDLIRNHPGSSHMVLSVECRMPTQWSTLVELFAFIAGFLLFSALVPFFSASSSIGIMGVMYTGLTHVKI